MASADTVTPCASMLPADSSLMQSSVPPLPALAQRQPERLSLLQAIAAAANGFGDLTKDSKNDYLRSSYLSLPGLLKAIKPVLLEHGVTIYSQAVLAAGTWVVRTTLAFVDGSEELSSDFPITDITNLQRIGAAFTYGTRYNLFALLAVCPDTDADGAFPEPAVNVTAHPLPGLPSFAPPSQASPQAFQAFAGTHAAPYGAPQPPHPAMIANAVQPIPILQ